MAAAPVAAATAAATATTRTAADTLLGWRVGEKALNGCVGAELPVAVAPALPAEFMIR